MPETAPDRHSKRRRAVTSIVATEVVRDVAEKLEPSGIEVMPVKGALLQHWLYDDPAERAMTDVDVLIRSHEARGVQIALEKAGYRLLSRPSASAFVMQSPLGLALDLHLHLFDPARYRLPTTDVFSRGSPDRLLFGAPVRLPSALDAYAHLIGKFGSDHLNASAVERLDEIARMRRRIEAPPELVARHLVRCGMRRVARYVLPLASEVTGDAFPADVLRHLPPDRVGEKLAALAAPVLAEVGPYSWIGAVTAHMLNDSLPRGLRSGVKGLVARPR